MDIESVVMQAEFLVEADVDGTVTVIETLSD
jgi:hypothetical protein